MGEARVPTWHAATGLQAESRRVYELFRDLLHHLPMSYTKLAGRIGVSQPAVSRWAADVSRPSLSEMAAVFDAVSDEVEEVRLHLDSLGEVLLLVQKAVRLYDGEADSEEADTQIRLVVERLRFKLEPDAASGRSGA